MALSEPFDLLADWPGWTTRFELLFRQEQSRDAGGRTYVKDLGDPLWTMAAQSKPLTPNLLDHWRARLHALENGLMTFKGYPLSRCYPIAYPNGSWPTGGSFSGVSARLQTIAADRKSIRVDDLPDGFVLLVGDMISIDDRDLHQVMEVATAATGGLTPLFEVRPHIWSDVAVGSPAPSVSVKRPFCLMSLIPGSVSSQADLSGRGVVSFEAIEARE